MINIVLKGVDEFLGAEVEKDFAPQVSKILHVSPDDVVVTCLHSMIFHGGVDQTSFHMIVTFEMEDEYKKYEEELVEFILSASKNFSVHAHVNFFYLSDTKSRIDNDYPLFVTEKNEVVLESEEVEEEEIYTGDIFADFEKDLKAKKK